MHQPARRADDAPAEHLPDALVPHAHAEHAEFRTELFHGFERDAGIFRRARSRADHDADRVHRADLFHGHLVVLHHDVVAPEVAEVLCVLKGSSWVYVHQ